MRIWCHKKQNCSAERFAQIVLGLEDKVTDEQLCWALDIAQASDFVQEKEGQLDAVVETFWSERRWSRQRLTIARYFTKAPFWCWMIPLRRDYLTEAKLLQAIKRAVKEHKFDFNFTANQ